MFCIGFIIAAGQDELLIFGFVELERCPTNSHDQGVLCNNVLYNVII